jgi:hypothetical protein
LVSDVATGLPVAGIRVGFGGHMSDLASDLVAQTDANGDFTISAVPQGSYPELIVDGAATAGGAAVVNASAPAYSAPCRVGNALDQSQGTGR